MKRLLVFLLFASGVLGQTPALVTGKIFDAGGNVATSGYVQFDIQPNSQAIQFFIPGIGSIAPPSVQCPINGSGLISCNVWGNDIITPANTNYVVTFAPGGNIINVVNGECIIGSAYNLNNPRFCPNVQVNPQQAIIRANPFDTNIIAPAADVFTVGSPLTYWAAGYFDNLFAHSIFTTNLTVTFINGLIPGTVTSVGLTTPSWLAVGGSPVTSSGTLAITPATGQTSHLVIGTCGSATTFTPCALTGADVPGGGGSVTSISTTSPISGGPITTTGTLSCPTCVVASSPGLGIAHFAGGTQTVTSSAINLASADVTGLLANANLAHPSMTVNGTTCTLGSSCTIGGGSSSFTTPNGYSTLPGGLIIQWALGATATADNTQTVNWPITFPNACLSVVTANNNVSGTNITKNWGILSFNTTGVSVQLQRRGDEGAFTAQPYVWGVGF